MHANAMQLFERKTSQQKLRANCGINGQKYIISKPRCDILLLIKWLVKMDHYSKALPKFTLLLVNAS